SNANVMVANSSHQGASCDSDNQPFDYARVEGIFEANVSFRGNEDQPCRYVCLEFLWIRRFQRQGKSLGIHGLDLLSLPSLENCSYFDFVDPRSIIQGCHVIP
ncbi:hypothetical protein BKA70DRAFT_1054487, partial [Coprinopsis sp. MPI-PUGE-AT-0042]